MRILIMSVLFSFFLASVTGQTMSVKFSVTNEEILRNLLLVGDHVLVGSNASLYRLDRDLTLLQSVDLTGGVNRLLLKINYTEGTNGDVLSFQEQNCVLFSSQNLTEQETVANPDNTPSASNSIITGVDDLVGIPVSDQSLFIARHHLDPSIVSMVSKIDISFSGASDGLVLSLIGSQMEESTISRRKFLLTFKDEEYVYFVYELYLETLNSSKLRIGRACNSDAGSSDGISLLLSTYMEAKLECEGGSSSSSATVLDIEDHLILFVAEHSGSNSVVCLFNVSNINQAMNEKLEDCKNGEGTVGLERSDFSSSQPCPSGLTQNQKDVRTSCVK